MEDMNGKTVDGIKMKIEIVDSRRARRTGPSDTDECFKCK
jgi:arginine/serine-rich splicing factor 7